MGEKLYSLAGDVAAICRSPAVDAEVVLILSRVFLIILGLWIHVGCASFGRTLRRAVMVYEQEGATFLVCMCFYLHEEGQGYASAVHN